MDADDIFVLLLTPQGRDDPYPLYAALHEMSADAVPVTGAVLVHGYDAIDSVLRDPAFIVADAARYDEIFPGWPDHPSAGMRAMLNLNAPDHTRIRAPIARAFTQRRVSGLEPAIVRMTDRLLDLMTERGAGGEAVEFMAEFAFRLPVTVICELLGIPEADREAFRPLAADLTQALELRADPSVLGPADAAAVRLHGYLADLVAERRAEPRDDLTSALAAISGDGQTLSDAELLENLTLLLVAGFETTTNLLGNGLQLVLQHPDLGVAVRDGTVPAAAFTEEVLRFDSPVQMTGRRQDGPAKVGDVPVPAGTEVITLLGAGNRDPRRFADPGTFDPRRAGAPPLSFGAGAHFCLGTGLARLEGAIAFPRLVSRFPRLAAAGQPERRRSLILRGFQTLPVTVA